MPTVPPADPVRDVLEAEWKKSVAWGEAAGAGEQSDRRPPAGASSAATRKVQPELRHLREPVPLRWLGWVGCCVLLAVVGYRGVPTAAVPVTDLERQLAAAREGEETAVRRLATMQDELLQSQTTTNQLTLAVASAEGRAQQAEGERDSARSDLQFAQNEQRRLAAFFERFGLSDGPGLVELRLPGANADSPYSIWLLSTPEVKQALNAESPKVISERIGSLLERWATEVAEDPGVDYMIWNPEIFEDLRGDGGLDQPFPDPFDPAVRFNDAVVSQPSDATAAGNDATAGESAATNDR
jgi:hypothetical protein